MRMSRGFLMDRREALAALAEDWKAQGKTCEEPTLWDLAVALARAHSMDDGNSLDGSPSGRYALRLR